MSLLNFARLMLCWSVTFNEPGEGIALAQGAAFIIKLDAD